VHHDIEDAQSIPNLHLRRARRPLDRYHRAGHVAAQPPEFVTRSGSAATAVWSEKADA
jgi:hypothetical protein